MDKPGRTCTKCGETKPETEYFKDNTRRSGKDRLMSQCKACNTAAGRSKNIAYKKKFGTDPTTLLWRRRKHGTEYRPPEGTPCEICQKPMVYQRGAALMCFDHDPTTHEFRGWICQQCNTGLGKLGDNLVSLQRAVDYLQQNHQPPHTDDSIKD